MEGEGPRWDTRISFKSRYSAARYILFDEACRMVLADDIDLIESGAKGLPSDFQSRPLVLHTVSEDGSRSSGTGFVRFLPLRRGAVRGEAFSLQSVDSSLDWAALTPPRPGGGGGGATVPPAGYLLRRVPDGYAYSTPIRHPPASLACHVFAPAPSPLGPASASVRLHDWPEQLAPLAYSHVDANFAAAHDTPFL